MSQFASAFTAATAEAIATINDTIEYRQVEYPCVLSEETYGNTLGEGGFEPGRCDPRARRLQHGGRAPRDVRK